MEKIYRHRQDRTGEAAIIGDWAQRLFYESFTAQGFNVQKGNLGQDKYEHTDFIIEKGGLKLTTDVKAPKKITRQDKYPSMDWTWVEFVGTTGYPGWLYGPQDTVSMLLPDKTRFMVVNTKELAKMAEQKTSPEFVNRPTDAYYKLYNRSKFGNSKDILTLVKYSDIQNCCFCTYVPVVQGVTLNAL